MCVGNRQTTTRVNALLHACHHFPAQIGGTAPSSTVYLLLVSTDLHKGVTTKSKKFVNRFQNYRLCWLFTRSKSTVHQQRTKLDFCHKPHWRWCQTCLLIYFWTWRHAASASEIWNAADDRRQFWNAASLELLVLANSVRVCRCTGSKLFWMTSAKHFAKNTQPNQNLLQVNAT